MGNDKREIKVTIKLEDNPNTKSLILSMVEIIDELEKEHNCDCTLFNIEVTD